MNHDSQLSWKIKRQIRKFSGQLTEGLDKPKRRFVTEMLYGIQASKDVKVSEVARSLNETSQRLRAPLVPTCYHVCPLISYVQRDTGRTQN